jgi:molybdenum cofactor synthesis domain-containing protein
MGDQPVTAAVLVIGNEILSGRTVDANLSYIAARLNTIGIRLLEARVVPDRIEAIVAAVNACREAHTYVFTTGGIGPTHDDITARAVAAAFGVPIERNREAVARLTRHYSDGGLNEARLSMADMPVGAVLIDNPVSQAPGFQLGNVFVLAGVPVIMQAMFDGLIGHLRGGAKIHSRTVSCYLAEGTIAAELAAVQSRFPEIEIGSYPFFRARRFGTSLVLRGEDESGVAKAAAEVHALIVGCGGEPLEQDP